MSKLKTFFVGVEWTDFDEIRIEASTRKQAISEALDRFNDELSTGKAKVSYCRKKETPNRLRRLT